MRHQLKWLAVVLGFTTLIAGSLGCATMMAANSGGKSPAPKALVQDEILAIGQPDETLAQKLGQPDAIAFIGKQNTYLLFKGGKELQEIAKLGLDGKRMLLDTSWSKNLFIKDKKVWGTIMLSYRGNPKFTDNEQTLLEKAGFTTDKAGIYSRKEVSIEGVMYPALKLSEVQLDTLTVHHKISLYDPEKKEPPANLGKYVIVPLAVAVDVILAPVYLGVGIVLLMVAH